MWVGSGEATEFLQTLSRGRLLIYAELLTLILGEWNSQMWAWSGRVNYKQSQRMSKTAPQEKAKAEDPKYSDPQVQCKDGGTPARQH